MPIECQLNAIKFNSIDTQNNTAGNMPAVATITSFHLLHPVRAYNAPDTIPPNIDEHEYRNNNIDNTNPLLSHDEVRMEHTLRNVCRSS